MKLEDFENAEVSDVKKEVLQETKNQQNVTVELENVKQGTEDQQNKNIEPENDIVTDSHFDPENISPRYKFISTVFEMNYS